MNVNPASTSAAGGGGGVLPSPGVQRVPDREELRAALRPPALPLPRPRTVPEVASRVNDLLGAERYREALTLADAVRSEALSAPRDGLALLRAELRCARLVADRDRVRRAAADVVGLLRRGGHPEQAAAAVIVLLEQGPPPARSGAADAAPAAGRRRGPDRQPPAEVLTVMRGLAPSTAPGAGGATPEPRRAVRRLRAALEALQAARDLLAEDPEQELRLRLAQALEASGDGAAATTAALDVLELIEERTTRQGAAQEDPQRLGVAARAVLSRTLATEHPLLAARHAVDALEQLHEVEDPPLRIGLITALLTALMAAGATEQAAFTAGRLASLLRSLGREALRAAPLLAIAAQRMQAGQVEAAWAPLEQARTAARAERDHRQLLEVSRLAAGLHERSGDRAAALPELARLGAEARWLVDDLATPAVERAQLLRAELSAHALLARRALDLGRSSVLAEATRAIERRTGEDGGRPLLPAPLLWDHRVDARMMRLIGAGEALAARDDEAARQEYERCRREVMHAIDEVPAGHDERARTWAVYLEDRHAHALAAAGRRTRALRVARRARAAWAEIGTDEDRARMDALIAELTPR